MMNIELRKVFGTKNIYFVFSIFLVFMFSIIPRNVYADTTNYNSSNNTCKSFISNNVSNDELFWQHRYEVKAEVDDEANYVIKINKDELKKNKNITTSKSDINFKVVKIESYNTNNKVITSLTSESAINSKISSSNKVISYSKGISIKNLGDGSSVVIVELAPTFKDKDLNSKCGSSASFKISMEFLVGSVIGIQYDYDIPSINATFDSSSKIDCTNYKNKWDSSKFEYKFCEVSTNPKTKNISNPKNDTLENKCDTEIDGPTPSPEDENYYTERNTSYYKHTEVETIQADASYTYHYTCASEPVKETPSCKIECEEVVTVEYGPPVAVVGGLCFEYNVRVTSRVSCGVKEKPEPPKYDGYCTPLPICIGSGIYRQGGPSSEFDSCVNECDGGVYSDRCSNKCYKKVYGKSVARNGNSIDISYAAKLNDDAIKEASVKKVSDNYGGKYICSGNSITWTPSGVQSRWHQTNSWGLAGYNYTWISLGIPRAQDCTDTCYWLPGSCGSNYQNTYMNPGEAKQDAENNTKVYNELVKKCESASKCSTKTAEFTISADVDGKTYYFPYTDGNDPESKDKLCSRSDGTNACIRTNTARNTTLVQRGVNGCYGDGELDNHWYQAEWTFPGSWIKYKNGELSYSSKTGNDAWQEMKNRFCLPFTVKPVNEKWWQYYYGKIIDSDIKSNKSQAFKDACITRSEDNLSSARLITRDEVEKWNINASTKKFGYYGWNIKISCFYAFSDSTTTRKSSSMTNEEKDKCVVGSQNYQVRSVDLKNLFPDSTGAKKLTSPTERGRTPGFNWSEHATNTDEKVGDYSSNPKTYADKVQELGYNVYSDKYLDYEINLTRSDIKQLRDSNHEYGNFDNASSGDMEIGDVASYKSNLIRNTLSDAKYPDIKALKCNNIAAHSSIGKGYSADCEG